MDNAKDGRPWETVPELLFERKELIPELQQLLKMSFSEMNEGDGTSWLIVTLRGDTRALGGECPERSIIDL